jgi:hypothetical protein
MIWGSIADEPRPCGRASCKNRPDWPAAAPKDLEIAFRAGWQKIKSELSAPDIGGNERRYMTAKKKYTDEPVGKVKVISDFPPSSEKLALKDETVKVTISLSKASIDFF